MGTWCDPYKPTADVTVRMVGPCAFETYRAVQAAALLPSPIGGGGLSQALENLAFQLGRWEQDPTNTTLRDRAVAALEDVIARVQSGYPSVDTSALEALSAAPTVDGFCAPISDLEDVLTRIAQRQVAVTFQPGVRATLPHQPVTYTLALENRGTLTTTYDLSVDLSPTAPLTFYVSRFTLPPGESAYTPLVVTPTALGYHALAADVQAVEDSLIQARATAGLNVVDAFVRVMAVSADPAFVETGVSSSTLAVQVANVANVYRDDAEAHRIAREAAGNEKVLAATSIAPVILARAGVLDGKQATVYDPVTHCPELEAGGARCTGERVQRDGRIVTARLEQAAEQFAETIVQVLQEL